MLSVILFMALGIAMYIFGQKIYEDFRGFSKPHGMKLEAVAKYLKVRFLHIPEHYECEPIKKKKSIKKPAATTTSTG